MLWRKKTRDLGSCGPSSTNRSRSWFKKFDLPLRNSSLFRRSTPVQLPCARASRYGLEQRTLTTCLNPGLANDLVMVYYLASRLSPQDYPSWNFSRRNVPVEIWYWILSLCHKFWTISDTDQSHSIWHNETNIPIVSSAVFSYEVEWYRTEPTNIEPFRFRSRRITVLSCLRKRKRQILS